MSFLVVYPDGSSRHATAIEPWLEDLFAGAQAIRPDGSPYVASKFLGGILLDGCPLNVVLGNGWQPGQQEVLRSAGITQCLPAAAPPPQSVTMGPEALPHQNVAPSMTPPPMGGTTGGILQLTETPTEREFRMGTIYRLLLEQAPGGLVDSGATYPGCSRSNPDGCKPIQFRNMDDAMAYAAANGEVPIKVSSSEEAWGIVEGKITVNETTGLTQASMFGGTIAGIPTPLLIGAAALLLLPQVMKKRR